MSGACTFLATFLTSKKVKLSDIDLISKGWVDKTKMEKLYFFLVNLHKSVFPLLFIFLVKQMILIFKRRVVQQ